MTGRGSSRAEQVAKKHPCQPSKVKGRAKALFLFAGGYAQEKEALKNTNREESA